MRAFVRPDGRRFVRDPDAASLAGIADDVYCTAEESDAEPYLTLGFAVHRREGRYRIPTSATQLEPMPGVRFFRADEVEETRLRLLDDELRQDVPGTDGWRWGEAGFREETYDERYFDARTYLVAVEQANGEYIGIARVWMNPVLPRLGFIGVRRAYRRRGIAQALVTHVFTELAERGVNEVSTEIDDTNVASRRLLEPFGAQRTGTVLELIRRAG
jgi:ribosomal protein S18 acetylase RimI-like enzyme